MFLFFTRSGQLIETQSNIDFAALLSHFNEVQRKHREMRVTQRKKKLAMWENAGLEKQKNMY